ncbi:hypothetical protein B7463_g5032, partial [Scytalidium lignicola]
MGKAVATLKKKSQQRVVEKRAVEEKEVLTPKKSPKGRKAKVEDVQEDKVEVKLEVAVAEESPKGIKKPRGKRKTKAETTEDDNDQEDLVDDKPKKKRKTKEEKEAEAMPLAVRTLIKSLKKPMYIGAHISAAGGVHNSINNALHIGGNSFALFLKSQRKWVSPPLASEGRDQFKALCVEHNYDATKHVVPHGSYLVNLAQADPEKAAQAYDCFLEDLKRCEALGIRLYNFHPGSTGPHPRSEAIRRIAMNLNKAHQATKSVVTLLENMAGAGNIIGSKFEDLRDIIDLVDDKSRVGVCIDTCHTFAAGYDLRSPENFQKTLDSFSDIVGMSYLKALHLNDSKAPLSSNRDLHANIGTGFLGLRAFHNVMNFEPFQGLPMVLETPIERKGSDGKIIEDKGVWATEIKLLESLIGTDIESDEFKKEEQRLQDLGAEERKKFQGQVDKKIQKTLDALFKSPAKKQGKRAKGSAEDSDAADDDEGCNH